MTVIPSGTYIPGTTPRPGAAEIARRIASGATTAAAVVDEHIRRAERWHPHLNAIVHEMFARARGRAREADARQLQGAPLGPLHGVPVTIKECFDIAGTPTTIGLARRDGHRADRTSPLVQRLEDAGAIVLGKTNVPELLVYYESDNPLYGRTNNPWDLARTPGGSSGGECAAIAAGCSALGLGSDIGGSVRVPAHYCGIHGLKPTSGRLSMRGVFGDELFPGQEVVLDQPGPVARAVEDLELAMSVLAAEDQPTFDEAIPPVPWRGGEQVRITGLRIGVYVDDGYVTPSPAVRRAVREAGAILRQSGAEVREFVPPGVPESTLLYFALLAADGGRWARTLMGSGTHDRRVADLARLSGLRSPVRAAVCAALRAAGQRRFAKLIGSIGRMAVPDYWRAVDRRARYRRRFLDAMDAAEIDVIICPPNAHAALRHGASYFLTCLGSYAMLYNLFGMPAGVVSTTRVRPGEESDRPASRDMVLRRLRTTEKGSAGLPVGVQVAARHWREDLVLAVMRVIESGVRDREDYPLRSLPPLPG